MNIVFAQDIQVYRYYRDLINFRQKGDPTLMLKCINPNEAKYFDPAAGIHIKFRLAGVFHLKLFNHVPYKTTNWLCFYTITVLVFLHFCCI